MQLREINKKSSDIKKIKRIYHQVFPLQERLPFWWLVQKAADAAVEFFGIYDQDKLIGLSFSLVKDDLAYLLFFAIAQTEQGKGYGTTALALLLKRYETKTFFLALEPRDKTAKNYDQRLRRHSFYERCGLVDLPCRIKEGSISYEVMGTDETTIPHDYEALYQDFLGPVLGRIINSELIT